jgi:mono/diheme cytochrome c family protein
MPRSAVLPNQVNYDKRRSVVVKRVLVACVITVIAVAAAIGVLGKGWAAGSEDTAVDYTKIVPSDLVKNTPKGKLVNPYKDTQADVVAQGQVFFRNYGCSGCHGGNGGGGMCPALTNDVWVYGGDDDTLFRLVALGSDELQKAGYTRIGHENVVGPMPPFGTIVKNADDLWKILAFVRSNYHGDPAYKFGAPADPAANNP